ncbi:DUF1697 domain-containing protein [Yinghuangia sp. ASG 101]|uniref:DUF1697 domain-containing protein n=1 Tax=Yinghuangia sp. ASG 101 TaxID=2896848 RepID=UPI001E487193|nr:DUF1697 domain-containing protein [Yinghuangia sp. ASG 101]UGQ15599.1 DUF1697 domain-containing protein [Yinghuangia sp. ASG 101]
MAELRALLADLGYADVRTLLQSGNAVLTAQRTAPADVARAIETALAATYGRDIKVMVRTAAEMRAVVEANPLAVNHPSRFLVTFHADPVDTAALAGIDTEAQKPDEMAVRGREIYFDLPRGIADAKLPLLVERALRVSGTARNWNTVTKLLALAEGH